MAIEPTINSIKPSWIIVLIARFLEQRFDGAILHLSSKNRTCNP
jgi:hypothetical protein